MLSGEQKLAVQSITFRRQPSQGPVQFKSEYSILQSIHKHFFSIIFHYFVCEPTPDKDTCFLFHLRRHMLGFWVWLDSISACCSVMWCCWPPLVSRMSQVPDMQPLRPPLEDTWSWLRSHWWKKDSHQASLQEMEPAVTPPLPLLLHYQPNNITPPRPSLVL